MGRRRIWELGLGRWRWRERQCCSCWAVAWEARGHQTTAQRHQRRVVNVRIPTLRTSDFAAYASRRLRTYDSAVPLSCATCATCRKTRPLWLSRRHARDPCPVDETERLHARGSRTTRPRVERLKPAFARLLSADGWLPDALRTPGLQERDGRWALASTRCIAPSDGSLCLFSLVIPTGVADPGARPSRLGPRRHLSRRAGRNDLPSPGRR